MNSQGVFNERNWESKQLQEKLTNSAIERRERDYVLQGKSLENHRTIEQKFNLDAIELKNTRRNEQSKWMDDSWEKKKDEAFRNAITKEEMALRPQARMSPADNPRITRSAAGETASSQERTSTSTESPEAARTSHTETPPTFAQLAQNQIQAQEKAAFSRKFLGTSKNILTMTEKGEAILPQPLPFSSGTQNALKQTNIMPGFFSQQQSTDRGWRQPFDAEAAVPESMHVRQGALVQPPAERAYRQVAVQESLMPRLQELIQKLSGMGHSWARMVVPVDSRTHVVVRFNTQNGRVKIHLSTPTEELCELVKDGWQTLAQGLSERGIQLDSPTFETNIYEH